MPRKEKKEVIIQPEITREEVKAFEKELEDYKNSVSLDCPINFYGQLVSWCAAENRELSQEEAERRGLVINEYIGGCHWSVVSYCLANKIISEKGIILKNWTEFNRKWRALKELKEARVFANKMNTPPINLEEMKKGIVKDFGPESPEEDLISVEDLPF